jgi:RNA polymerase sigma-70 factor (ECF subfamily)
MENGEAEAQLLEALETGVRGLSTEERELVEQKYFAGESVRNLAESLGTSEKAVESRLGRVRRKLKQALLAALKHEQAD